MCDSCGSPPVSARRRQVLSGLSLSGLSLTGLGLGAAGVAGLDLGAAGSGTASEAAADTRGASTPAPDPLATLRRQHAAAGTRDSQLAQDVRASAVELDGTSAQVLRAVQAVQQVAAALSAARADLSQARAALAEARRTDTRLAGSLGGARARLDGARSRLAGTKAQAGTTRDAVGDLARQSYARGQAPGLLALLTSGADTDLLGAGHAVGAVLADQNATITRLHALARVEQAQAAALAGVEADTEQAKVASVASVARVDALTAAAAGRDQELTDLLAQRRRTLATLERARALDARQYRRLQAERSRNETLLRRIGAAEEREAARERAARARAARERAARARTDAGTASAAPIRHGTGTGTFGPSGFGVQHLMQSPGTHRIAYPVSAPITSPYGMRLHPTLHVWKLHDGTDFGVPTGTPLRSAAAGTVISVYFNVAYGNRVIIDLGIVDGYPLATSYNHLSAMPVGVGQRVSAGEVVAISGATGWVTGPHLHFMVYVDGTPVDSMTWL